MLPPGIGKSLDAQEVEGVRAVVLSVSHGRAMLRYYNGVERESKSPVRASTGQNVIFCNNAWVINGMANDKVGSTTFGETLRQFAFSLLRR